MKVMEVNSNNLNKFNEAIQQGEAVVKFYADWCGHCQDLNPKWNVMTSHLKNAPGSGLIASVPEDMISRVNCDSDILGYPTIRYMVGGKKRKDYNGKREVKDLEKFVKSTLGKAGKKKKINQKEERIKQKEENERNLEKIKQKRKKSFEEHYVNDFSE